MEGDGHLRFTTKQKQGSKTLPQSSELKNSPIRPREDPVVGLLIVNLVKTPGKSKTYRDIPSKWKFGRAWWFSKVDFRIKNTVLCVLNHTQNWYIFLFINRPHKRSMSFLWTDLGKFHPFDQAHWTWNLLKSIKSHVMCNSQCLKATKQNNYINYCRWYIYIYLKYNSVLSHLPAPPKKRADKVHIFNTYTVHRWDYGISVTCPRHRCLGRS